MWNPNAFMESLYDRFAADRREKSRGKTWAERRGAIREQLYEALALEPLRAMRIELNPVLLERVELDDHIRERVEFGTIDGMRVPAYVLIPKGRNGRLPAVLAIHGHGYGSREIVGLAADGTDRRDQPTIHGDYALELAKRGMLVIAPEVIGFGDRRLAADMEGGKVGNSSCQAIASQLMLYGLTIGGLRVYEALRALDYVSSREDADPARVGCVGFSGGGLIGAYASALDERIRSTVLWGFTNTFKSSIMAMHHCIDNYVPGVLQAAELPEYIGLIAPRSLFIESGEQDRIFPVHGVKEALGVLEGIYREAGAADQLRYALHGGGHQVGGQEAYPWLAAELQAK